MKMERVLVVDDDKQMCEFISDLIESKLELSVCTALSAKDAIEVMTQRPIDILVTDILMPKMDGTELVTQSKKLLPNIKVLLMSGGGTTIPGDAGYDYLKTAQRLTGEKYTIRKPFSVDEFITALKQLLED